MKVKDEPLNVTVVGSRLIISIGIDTLAFADSERTGIKVTNPQLFAKDVQFELRREKEDGSTKLTDLFDEVMQAAVENGSAAVEQLGPEQ